MEDARWVTAEDLAEIRERYKKLAAYSAMKVTCIDLSMRDKRYKRHVPYITPHKDSRHWGRDKWFSFESLPREFRDMVNNDSSNPEDALQSALELWNEMEANAESDMEYIIRVEGHHKAVSTIPEWLRQESKQCFDLISKLMAERAEKARLAAIQKAVEREAFAQRQRELAEESRRYVPAHTRERWTVGGSKLSDVDVIDTKGLRPHELRELMTSKMIRPLAFERHVTHVKGGWITDNPKKQEEIDNRPPDKINPMHVRRGRNY